MRVCMITSLHSPKDDRIFFKEAISLKEKGCEVSILCFSDQHGHIKDMSGNVLNLDNQSKIDIEGIQIIGVKKPSGFFQNILHKLGKGKCWNQFIKKAKELNADVYHAHEPQTAFIGLKIKSQTNAKLVYDAHEPWIFSRSKKEWLLRQLTLSRLSNIISANNITQQYLLAKNPKLNTEVLYNCSPTFFTRHRRAQRNELIICHEGTLLFNRGLKLIIDALIILKIQVPKFKFRIIGDVFGEEKRFLQKRILTNNLENNIEITGWLSYNDVPKNIADCSIGLITNTNEKRNTLAGPSNKLFNYMTMGLAIISVDLPPSTTIINETACGVVLEKRDPQFLAKAIQTLLDNTAKRQQLQENSLIWAKKKFNWKAEQEKLFQFYDRLK